LGALVDLTTFAVLHNSNYKKYFLQPLNLKRMLDNYNINFREKNSIIFIFSFDRKHPVFVQKVMLARLQG